MRRFSVDIETHVLNNRDEKMHDMAGEMIVEKPELMEVRDASSQTPKLVFAYCILYPVYVRLRISHAPK
jgi:hypothetical protein